MKSNRPQNQPGFMGTPEERFWRKVDKSGECWLWTGGVDSPEEPYGRFHANGKAHVRAHRFAYELCVGPIPDGMAICHRCDNPRCVNPSHLFVGTTADNNRDRDKKGRTADRRGTRNTQAKVNESAAIDIRNSTESAHSLAARYGVAARQIRRIRSGYSWSHVA